MKESERMVSKIIDIVSAIWVGMITVVTIWIIIDATFLPLKIVLLTAIAFVIGRCVLIANEKE